MFVDSCIQNQFYLQISACIFILFFDHDDGLVIIKIPQETIAMMKYVLKKRREG